MTGQEGAADPDQAYLLFGGSGHGRSIADVAKRLGMRLAGVVDPNANSQSWSVPIIRSDAEGITVAHRKSLLAVLGIGGNGARLRLARELLSAGVHLPAVIASTATVSGQADFGFGTVVMEHAHVGPKTTLGLACVVNSGAIVEHDCSLGDGTHCAPGSVVTGSVRCGAKVLVGAGAVVLPGLTIGGGVVIGAGAAVVASIGEGQIVSGVPARSKVDPAG